MHCHTFTSSGRGDGGEARCRLLIVHRYTFTSFNHLRSDVVLVICFNFVLIPLLHGRDVFADGSGSAMKAARSARPQSATMARQNRVRHGARLLARLTIVPEHIICIIPIEHIDQIEHVDRNEYMYS